jgi:Zn ribbon nucleic-acid-binding protein
MNYANSSPAPASLSGNTPVSLRLFFEHRACKFLAPSVSLSELPSHEILSHLKLWNIRTDRNMAATLADNGVSFVQPVCQNCQTSTTPLWRRDEMGSVLCNACGLFLKLHSRPRPISLKTDVIKSRNRVKSTPQGQRKKVGSVIHAFLGIVMLTPLLCSPPLRPTDCPYLDRKQGLRLMVTRPNGDPHTRLPLAPPIDLVRPSLEQTPPISIRTQTLLPNIYSTE